MAKRNRKQKDNNQERVLMPRISNKILGNGVDVVVVTGGRFDMLEKCLTRLRAETLVPINIHVVDNATPPDERKVHAELFEGLHVKRLPENMGFPPAGNAGAQMGKAPLILFVGDDVFLKDDAISQLVKAMEYQDVGVVGTKLLFPVDISNKIRPAGKVQHIGLAVTIRGDIIHPLMGWSPENPKTCISRDVFAVTGASMMVRRELFYKAGGFDTVYGKGTYEDAELCLRIRKLGYRIVINTEAQGYHYVGATAEKRQEAFPLQMNSIIFKSRWLNSGLMTWDQWSYG